jgi:hypothetical protein
MFNSLKKFRGEDSEYIEGLSPLPPTPPKKEKEKKSLFQRIKQHSSKRHDEQTTSLDGLVSTSTSASTPSFPPPEIPGNEIPEIPAEEIKAEEDKKKQKKKSLYQRFEEAERGEIKPEDVLKYTGKTKEELDAWAKTEAYVAGNQPATGVVGGVWGRVQDVEMRFPPKKETEG